MQYRIKKVRKDAGLNQTQFGSVLGVSRDAIATYESGRVIPDASKRMLICEKFNVNPDWLENGGNLEPYKSSLGAKLTAALRNAPAIAAMLEELTAVMSLEDWKNLNAIIEKAIQYKHSRRDDIAEP